MPLLSSIGVRLREVFRSAFTELSWWKKRLLQLSGALLLIGAGVKAYAFFSDGQAGAWTSTMVGSGLGCMFGFLVGAAVRIFIKLAVLVGVGVAALLFGLSALGWVELPWSSFGEISRTISDSIQRGGADLQGVLSGYLPPSAMTGLGLASGLTQRPDMDPDD